MDAEQPELGKSLPFRTINDIAIHCKDKETRIEYQTQLRWQGVVKFDHCNHDKAYTLSN